jgi:four helix bundle protein
MDKNTKIRGFQDLIVWQKSLKLAEDVYRVTKERPFATDYGLRDQIRKAAVSIMSNIAEGHGRCTNKDFIRFLSIANGSANEVQAQLCLAEKLGYVDQTTTNRLLNLTLEITKMIKVLSKRLK